MHAQQLSSTFHHQHLSCISGILNRPLTTLLLLVCHAWTCTCRRDVWHGEDMAGAGQRRARWNEALLESAVAPAYAALVQEAARLLGPCSDFWRLLPLGQGSVPEPWLRVAAALYARLADRAVLYSPVGGGKWLPPQQALLPDAACYGNSSSSSSTDSSLADAGPHQQASAAADAAAGFGGEVALVGVSGLGFVPPPLRASELASLLVQLGLPLVVGLGEEQQRCMMQWTSGVMQVGIDVQLGSQDACVGLLLGHVLTRRQLHGMGILCLV